MVAAARRVALRRRGAQAVEFALIAPVLVMLIAGIVDYGWFFWREAIVTNALRTGVRAGSLQRPDPDTEGVGECAACLLAAAEAAEAALEAHGVSGTLAPSIERLPATGTPCAYAIVLESTIAHERLMPLIPGPSAYDVRVVAMAQSVPCD